VNVGPLVQELRWGHTRTQTAWRFHKSTIFVLGTKYFGTFQMQGGHFHWFAESWKSRRL